MRKRSRRPDPVRRPGRSCVRRPWSDPTLARTLTDFVNPARPGSHPGHAS